MQLNHRPRLLSGLSLALAAAALSAGSGCAAVKATQQPEKKDMHVLDPGVARTHVIAELGTPAFSEERNGVMVDVFAFKQGYRKETKALRAVGHGAADVMTFGLWEVVGIPIEGMADGTDVKVEVTYDQDRRVQSVNVLKGDDAVHPKPLFAKKSGTTTR